MKWFRFRKKKREETPRQEDMVSGLEELLEDDVEDKTKIKKYVMHCCEQMADLVKEMGEEKAEYKIVSEYLNDIQLLEDLPKEDWEQIQSAAENVTNLNLKRDEYYNSEKNISDVQFAQMQQEEEQIPAAIEKLKANEAYQDMVRRDMRYLEGEKTQWYYHKRDLLKQQKLLKKFSFFLIAFFFLGMAALFVLQTEFLMDISYEWIGVVFISAAGGGYIFLKMSSNQTKIRQSELNMNYAIRLLNKVKLRYVNITNAVDYARDKYHVKNAREFRYLWEEYLNELKDREAFRLANEDLEYYTAKLVRLLRRYRLYDADVWVSQSFALVDKKEMVEVKHNLIVRRQKLRARIEFNNQNMKSRREEVNRILKRYRLYTPEIGEAIDSIDKLDVG